MLPFSGPEAPTGQDKGDVGPSGSFQRAGTHPPGPAPVRRRPPREPAVAAGGSGAPRQGLGRGLRLTQQKRGSSACQEGDKASPYRELPFQLPPSEGRRWALVKAERVPFMSPSVLRSSTCPCAHRTVASMPEFTAWGQRLREDVITCLPAWASGELCGICKATRTIWALVLPSEHQKKRFQSSRTRRCRRGPRELMGLSSSPSC